MPAIQLDSFSGISPKVAPRLLPENGAQTARNCWLAEGNLKALESTATADTLPDNSRVSIFPWRRNNTMDWLSFVSDTDVQLAPIPDDQYARIYYTDGTTLHEKLWNAAEVTIADVSFQKPAAPTITKRPLMDFSGDSSGGALAVKLYYGTGLTGTSWQAQYTGFKLEDNVVEIYYYISAAQNYATFKISKKWWIDLRKDCSNNNYTKIPTNPASESQDVLYNTVSDIVDGTTELGTFQVISLDAQQDVSDYYAWTVGNTTTTFYGSKITLRCKLDFSRNTKQFQVYVQTLVDSYGQESPPSDPSEEVEWDVNEKVTVTTHTGTTPGGVSASKARLYRSATGTAQTKYLYLTEVTPKQSFVDTLRDADLSEEIPLIENPPAQMKGLVSMAGGFYVAFNGRELYFSEPYLPYSWPDRYKLTLDYEIIGLAAKENDLTVTTKGTPYYGSGSHPDILTPTKMTLNQACVSKRGIAYVDNILIYPSPDGLVMVSGGQAKLITENMYTRAQWQALEPSTMIAAGHDGKYIGFTSQVGLILDFTHENGTLTTTTLTASGMCQDLLNDELYLIVGDEIVSWRDGDNLQYTWKSKEYQFDIPLSWSCAKIFADGYTGSGSQTLVLKLYADGTEVLSKTVTSGKAFRLEKTRWSKSWSFEVIGYDNINRIMIATAMSHLRAL